MIPTVLLARIVNNISDEFRTPHSSLVNPLIDAIKAYEVYGSISAFKSES